jgi:hypothetical protein
MTNEEQATARAKAKARAEAKTRRMCRASLFPYCFNFTIRRQTTLPTARKFYLDWIERVGGFFEVKGD